MRKALLGIALALALSACASVDTAWNVVTGARVSPQVVYVTINVFDGLKRSATNYLRLCHQSPASPVCSKVAEVDIVRAVRAGTVARNNLRAYMKAHPDALGASGVYDAFTSASDTLKQSLAIYGVAQ